MSKIRCASINIRYDNPEDHWPWHKRISVLSGRLHAILPDVIATQEGRRSQLLELADQLAPVYQLVDGHRDWHESKMYPCLFFNASRIKVLKSADRWLSKTPEIPHSIDFGSHWPKLATMAQLQVDGINESITVASFHLDNMSSEARPFQANVLANQLEWFEPGAQQVLMGDANDQSDSPAIRVFQKFGFSEIWNFATGPKTYHGFGNQNLAARIDYIFFRGNRLLLKQGITDSMNPPFYSDHIIVFADFILKKDD